MPLARQVTGLHHVQLAVVAGLLVLPSSRRQGIESALPEHVADVDEDVYLFPEAPTA
jgi:hypothetical protein